jgi:hypothetical protein
MALSILILPSIGDRLSKEVLNHLTCLEARSPGVFGLGLSVMPSLLTSEGGAAKAAPCSIEVSLQSHRHQ